MRRSSQGRVLRLAHGPDVLHRRRGPPPGHRSADRSSRTGSGGRSTDVAAGRARARRPGRDRARSAVSATADVADSARIGLGSRVWHLAQVGEDAVLGRACVVGRGAYIGPGVRIGDHVKIQNYALVYQPATLEDGVFVGPAVVLTNDLNPRAVDVHRRPKSATVGRRSPCTSRKVRRWVPARCALPRSRSGAGRWSVPERSSSTTFPISPSSSGSRRGASAGSAGRASPCGGDADATWHCERTGDRYVETEGKLHEIAT